MLRSSGSVSVLLLGGLIGLCASGCKVTSEDIDEWMGTQKGPGKIVAVLLADKYEDELRVHAGLALVRMEPREDVDGVTELQAAIRQLPGETQQRIVDAMTPELIELMNGESTPQADDDTIPPRQIRAKDAAFLLVHYASEEQSRELTNAVVDWYAVDFNGRNLAGAFSAEQVVRQLGAPAASRLVNALNPRELPAQAMVQIAELIAALGNAETKTRTAERLVAMEQEMESSEFLDWLKDRLRAQLRERQGEDAEINEDRVTGAAMLNRENYITLGALPAMKHLNGQEVIQDRLLAMAQATSGDQVTAEQLLDRRALALVALEGAVRESQVDALLDLALNAGEAEVPTRVRDNAFDRLGDARSAAALPRLWETFRSTEEWNVRWRVGSLILTIGGPAVVQEFFTSLDGEEYAHRELYGYGERLSQLRPPPVEFVNAQLAAEQWFRQVIALFFWEKHASEESEIARVTALESAETPTQGEDWEAQEQQTVGQVAGKVAEAIRQRLASESGDEESDEESSEDSDEGDSEESDDSE